ncbi:hypothetical protein ACU9CW_001574 [Cronobacter dublinensis]
MAVIEETNTFDCKSVYVNENGNIEIYHGDESVVLDKEQARDLVCILQRFASTGDIE